MITAGNAETELFCNFFSSVREAYSLLDPEDLKWVIAELKRVRRAADQLAEKKKAELEKIRKEQEHQEYIEQVISMELPLDYNNAFSNDERAAGIIANSVDEGLILSLNTLGKVDIEFIAQICGMDCKTVIQSLKGAIYQNPDTWGECFYQGWETADEYLSGNLMRKYNVVKAANETYHGYFNDNLKAIQKALPLPISYQNIYVKLGSPWIPPDVIMSFISYLAERDIGKYTIYSQISHRYEEKNRERVFYDQMTGRWDVDNLRDCCISRRFFTNRIPFHRLLEKILNQMPIQVYDTVSSGKSKKSVINQADTLEANAAANRIREEFQEWIWTDSARRDRLETLFEERFSCVRKRRYDGSFLTFPGLSPDVKLYPYQKNAVARILFSPNTLLAHEVGAGKTYIMIAAGMKMRQVGTSKKNLYVVPNNLVTQWKETFLKMYPSADILCISPIEFTKAKRAKVLEDIRDHDYDGIIMAYSCFDMLEISQELYGQMLQTRMREIDKYISENATAKSAKKLRDQIAAALRKLANDASEPSEITDVISFEELGITGLFVDEAHNYKNLPIETANQYNGINPKGSVKCASMLKKVRAVQQQNNGGGVTFATATPITNSVSDCFAMQHYLQSGELKLIGLAKFDQWIGMFAEAREEFEIDVDTTQYRLNTRLCKYHNLQELIALFSMIADYHKADNSDILPVFNGYQNCVVSKSSELKRYLDHLSHRADLVRKRRVVPKQDNMLQITCDGRKAALDIRLAQPNKPFSYDMKVYRCAENVFDVWASDPEYKCTQIVFCDIATPKQSFNIYDELKSLLIKMGIHESEIAFIHDADTDAKRTEIFKKVNAGKIRVLIGSTFKLGLGVNVQTYLKAVHHLDVPWRPSDMTQREGRILRPGNKNKEIKIFRYITEGSFDAYSWQLLEIKQRFISQIVSGEYADRSGDEVDNTALTYGEVKALAVGNPLIRARVETANELSKYRILQKKLAEHYEALRIRCDAIPAEIEQAADARLKCEADIDYLKQNPETLSPAERRAIRNAIDACIRTNTKATEETPICSYCGFSLSVPANMIPEHPVILLRRTGKYPVELGESAQG